MFSLSHHNKSFLPTIKTAENIPPQEIADIFYRLIADHDLNEFPEILNALAQETGPQARPPISEPEKENKKPFAKSPGYRSWIIRPKFNPGYLHSCYLVLARHLKKNESVLDAPEVAQTLRLFAAFIKPHIDTIATLKKAIKDAENALYADVGHEVSIIDGLQETIRESKLRIAALKQKHSELFQQHLDEINASHLKNTVKAMLIILRDTILEAKLTEYYRQGSDDDESADEMQSPCPEPVKRLHINNSADKKFEEINSSSHGHIKALIVAGTEENQQSQPRPKSPPAQPEGPDFVNDSPTKELESKNFEYFFLNSNNTILSQRSQGSFSPRKELIGLAKNPTTGRATIIKHGLLEFGMHYITDESMFARKAREILEETNPLEWNIMTLGEAGKKKMLVAAELYLQEMIRFLSTEISAQQSKNETVSAAEKDLNEINSYLQQISSHLKTISSESETDKSCQTSESLMLLTGLRAVVIHMLLKRKMTSLFLPKKITEIEIFARSFIFAITEVDLKAKNYEKNFAEIFINFIKNFSSCDDREAKNIFNELLMNLPLTRYDKARYAIELFADRIDNIYQTFCLKENLDVHKIIEAFIEKISDPDFDIEKSLLGETKTFIEKTGLKVEFALSEADILKMTPCGKENIRLKAISAGIDYLDYLENFKNEHGELAASIEKIQTQTKSSLRELLALDLQKEEHERKVDEIIHTMRDQCRPQTGINSKPSLLKTYSWLWPLSYLPSLRIFGGEQTEAEIKLQKGKEEQRETLKKQFSSLAMR